jgi:hypothetical protein
METETPLPTETLTPSPTFTPTLALSFLTELPDGRGAQFQRTVTADGYTTNLLLFAILISLWGMWFFNWLNSMRGGRD